MQDNDTVDENLEETDRPDAPNLSSDEIERLSRLIYGKRLEEPILGKSYRIPDLSKNYCEPTILDTSLSHIAVYAHLKTYDLKVVERPETPTILHELRAKFSEDTASCRSSRLVPSTARTNGGKSSLTPKSHVPEKSRHRN